MHIIHSHLIAQIIGFAAVGCTLALFQFNNRRTMLLISCVGAVLYATHFSLLGARTGAAMNCVSALRAAVFFHYDQQTRPRWILYLFLVAFMIAGALSWQGWYSVLPVIGMTTGTLAFWQLDTRRIRLIALIAPPCWFVYNVIVGSYPGMLSEIVNASSNVTAIYRFDLRQRLKRKVI